MNRIIVVDGNSLLFRAYFATSFSGNIMTTKDGTPTNAIYAFSNMMSKIVGSLKEQDKLFVSFDTGKKTFRHEALESYKAQRKPIDDALKVQLPLARLLLKAMNIFYFELDGHEGDDIAGTVAKMASLNGYDVEIYTSDKDFLQLIDDNIKIFMIRKGLSDIEVMDEAALMAKMSLTPSQIPDYKGLTGDPSDNLKGIAGIGDKTAIKLLQEYGSLESIISHMEQETSKLAQKVKEGKDEGILCKQLATIETDVPLPFSLDDLTYTGYDYNELSAFYTKYEFYSLLKKLKPNTKHVTGASSHKASISSYQKHYISSFKELNFVPTTFIVDYFGKNYASYKINGFIFCKDDNVYYLSYDKNNLDPAFLDYLSSPLIKKDTYDSKSIKVALKKDGITLNGVGFDLSLATYLINSSLNSDPQTIYAYYGFNILEAKEEEFNLFDESPLFFNMAFLLESIKPICLNKLQEIGCLDLYQNVELPLSDILSDMEVEGFPLDKEVLDSINARYEEILRVLTSKIMSYVDNGNLNLASPKQVADLLFHRLNLPSNKKESTSIEILHSLAHLHPIVPLIIEHRKYSKLISTYSSGLREYILDDNKIHATFNQALTTTGRLSSSDPNLQNISIRSEEGKEIRKAFFYKEDNIYLLSLDYSQIELRILSSLSSCQSLIDAFNNGEDIHAETARKIFNIPLDQEVSEDLRRKAKTVNFGIVYGISDFGLAEQLEIAIPEARQIINKFYEHYPEIKNYFETIITTAKEKGYVETLFKRRRYIPELSSDNYQTREFGKRAAMNAPIQGTAADLIKMAMVLTGKELKKHNFKSQIVLQIHDELILKVYEEEREQVYKLVKECMENVYKFKCALEVDGSCAKTWFDAK